MRRRLVIAAATVALVAAAAIAAWAALRGRGQQEWTTTSPAALAELRLGIDAQRKYYHREAQAHFEKALELDPDFAMAKRMLMRADVSKERRERLRQQLAATDRSRLTPREVFLIDYTLAQAAEAPRAQLDEIVEGYLRRHPRDPYALSAQGDLRWDARRWEEAEETFQKLLAVDPNWVDAQNKMGYLSMALGRFAEAEDRFRTYRFIAPDQANPHDSLGELLVLTGRFAEAQRELEAALRIRPDFCISYFNLIDLARLSGQPERASSLVAALDKNGCGPELVASATCAHRVWGFYQARDWERLAAVFHEPCIQQHNIGPVLPHLAAVLAGDLALAREIEAFAAKRQSTYVTRANPVLPHTAAVREVAEGEVAKALEHFAATDAQLQYRQLQDGLFKMYNRLQWAHALELSGDRAAAERLVREVEGVNRAMAARYAGLPAPEPRRGGSGAAASSARR
jgi:Flp pilus assembly protein TadD